MQLLIKKRVKTRQAGKTGSAPFTLDGGCSASMLTPDLPVRVARRGVPLVGLAMDGGDSI